jgi:hypothetical protein
MPLRVKWPTELIEWCLQDVRTEILFDGLKTDLYL